MESAQCKRGVGVPCNGIINENIAIAAYCARSSEDSNIIVAQVVSKGRSGYATATERNGKIIRTDLPCTSTASEISRRHCRCISHLNVRCRSLDEPAGAANRIGRIQRSIDIDLPDIGVTQQINGSIHAGHRLRLNDTSVVDHRGAERIGGLGSQDDFPSIHLDQLVVLGQRVECTHIDAVRQQRTATYG